MKEIFKILGLVILAFAFVIGGGFLYEDGLAWIGLILEVCGGIIFVYGFYQYIKQYIE